MGITQNGLGLHNSPIDVNIDVLSDLPTRNVMHQDALAITEGSGIGGESSSISTKIHQLQDGNALNDPHAFIIMPFGQKEGPDGGLIDFNAIYEKLIKPALIDAGFEPFRADEETVSGDILTDMFQELLLADLVVVDMSIDNANVFYELGVRHAFRKRGIVHIQSGRDYMPFDVFNVRTVPYHINSNGVPDDVHVERDKKNLIRVTRDTWASDSEAVHSPIFSLLTGLVEPDRRSLRTPLATGFWREFTVWEQRIAVARRQKRVGDILLLTEEISNPLCKEDAVKQVGLALREMGRHELALQEYRKGLAVNPKNSEFRREEAVLLNRIGRVDEAIIKLESLLADEPSETQATSYLGRIYTSIWQQCWIGIEDMDKRQEAAFEAYQWAIKSMETYLRGFNADRNILDPGIKALTLATLLVQLADRCDNQEEPDGDIQRIRTLLSNLRPALRFSLDADVQLPDVDYWTWASLANWMLCDGDSERQVSRIYRKALSFARKNVFHLHSSLRQLDLFCDLEINIECARTGRQIIQNEINRIETDGANVDEKEYPPPETEKLAILFTGHKLDRENAPVACFPSDLEDEVRRQIDLALDRGKADSNDHGFTAGAACGGDIIFIEACLARGMKVHLHMPCPEAQYINEAVSFGGETWIQRFYAIRNHSRVNSYYQSERVGNAPEGIDPYERNARWSIYASLVLGVDKLRLIALWNGKMELADSADGIRISETVSLTQKMGAVVDPLNIDNFEYLFKTSQSTYVQDISALVTLDARIAVLREMVFFNELHAVDLTQIAAVLGERKYMHDEYLAKQGDCGEELFIIVSGEVSIRVIDSHHQDKEIVRRKPGDLVGELAVLHNEARIASLAAVGEVVVLILNRSHFTRIMNCRPQTGQAITLLLAKRLTEASFQEAIEI